MDCFKCDNSYVITPKSKAVVKLLQLNWSFIFILIFHTFYDLSDQITF